MHERNILKTQNQDSYNYTLKRQTGKPTNELEFQNGKILTVDLQAFMIIQI